MQVIDIYVPEDHPHRFHLVGQIETFLRKHTDKPIGFGLTPKGWNVFASCPNGILETVQQIAKLYGFEANEYVPEECDGEE